MAQRNIYTGRANKGTIGTIDIDGNLYIVYASGQDIIIYIGADCFVQSISHPNIVAPITVLTTSSAGRLAAVSGNSVEVFDPRWKTSSDNSFSNDSKRGSFNATLWEHSSSFSLDIDTSSSGSAVSCRWLSDNRLVVSIAQTLLLWSQDGDKWELVWSQETGGNVDIIASIPGADMFVSGSFDCRLLKVWQFVGIGGSLCARFQYIVHPDPVCHVFWKQPTQVRSWLFNSNNDRCLTLITVTLSGMMYFWRARAADDFGRLHNSQPGIRCVLAGTVDLSNGADFLHSAESALSKRLVSVGMLRRPCKKGYQTDSHALVEEEKTSADATHSSKEGSIESNGSDVSVKLNSRGISTPGGNGCTDVDTGSSTDSVYAVYDDGSVSLWNFAYQSRFSTVCKSRKILETPAISKNTLYCLGADRSGVLLGSLLWTDELGNYRLAAEDDLGHVYLFDVPQPSADGGTYLPLAVRDLWDGHREQVFHISVDPYSQRLATHSVEGELLIWDTLAAASATETKADTQNGQQKQQGLLISRRMALDGTQIRTIAWAPTESEFIAATDKHVYRLVFDTDTLQWVPSDSALAQLKEYDRIFTFPSDISAAIEKSNGRMPYFISTVRISDRSIQTWKVPVDCDGIEYVGCSNISQASHFDLASRVMPVSYPFFSLDNILATFDANSGKLRIWGVRTAPKLVWFCSKEHLIPCMNVKMIRYNSIDKAAIVSTEEDGSQVITVWVFSSTSRESHYLPAGTIYPRRKTNCVREIRWHLTEYAQSYLGIQWDDRIDVYCQERNLDGAWKCIFTIHASDYGIDKLLGSFSFTASGEPIFSVEKKLILCSEVIPNSSVRISDAAFDEHGELPMIHPFVLIELLSWGKIDIVKQLLSLLYDYMRLMEISNSTQAALPIVSLHELITNKSSATHIAAKSSTSSTSKYAGLFSMQDTDGGVLQIDDSEPDFGRFNAEKAEYLLQKLTEIKIKGITAIEQARLMSIVGTISASLIKDQPLDDMGLRYLLKLHLLEIENKRKRLMSELPYRELNWALHSSSQAILLQACLQQHASSGLTWESARRMGLFMWLSDTNVLHSEVEKMARNIFIVENRDPTKCAIFYLALKKKRLLHGLWRTAHNHPEHNKMLAFLSHDFSEARWRTAAAKNAYVLLSRQRYMDAATFFMLSDKLIDAATICITQLKDIQLAITVCRCYEGENGPVLKELIWKHILPDAFKRQDRWLASLAFGIIGKYDLVLQSLTDDLSQFSIQIGVDAQVSAYSPMDVLDTELLILYRNILGHSPHYRAPLIVQAQLIASTITIFECLGVPMMALVVLEWWRRELYDITKRLELKPTPLQTEPTMSMPSAESTANSINTGTLDMSAFSGFAGFSPASSSKRNSPAVAAPDPISSGMLSMDSFGSSFSGMTSNTNTPSSNARKHGTTVSTGISSKPGLSNGADNATMDKTDRTPELTTDAIDDATLAMDIEDTPVQYACRVMLALQIADYIRRVYTASAGSNDGAITSTPSEITLGKEIQIIADTLRLPLSVFPSDHE